MSVADAPDVCEDSDFRLFYGPYPRKEKRDAAERRWKAMSKRDRLDAIAASAHYASYAANNADTPLMLPATFLSKGDRCWVDWVHGVPEARRRNGKGGLSTSEMLGMARAMGADEQQPLSWKPRLIGSGGQP